MIAPAAHAAGASQAPILDEWDANGQARAGVLGGGSGTWSVTSNTWSDTTGQFVGPMTPQPGFAIFGGSAGTVTVDDSNGQVSATGMQFLSNGYHLTGGAIELVGQNGLAPIIDVCGCGSVTIDNVLQGTSGLNKTDGGILVLTAANTYSGGTTITAGTLEGDTVSLHGNITNNAALIFDQASDGTFTGAITGTGNVTKTGAGTLILDGANTYTGSTTVSAGTLEIGDSNATGASIHSAVSVQNGGTLRGHGTIVGNVTSDGLVWPGGSLGTLSIQGNYTQSSNGTLQIDVTPTQSSLLKVSGSATLAGTLDLIFAPGAYSNSKFALVQAGSLAGTFSTVEGTVPASYDSKLDYSSTAVELALTQRAVMPLDSSLFSNLMRSVDLNNLQDMDSVLDVALLSRDVQCDVNHTPFMQDITTSCDNGVWAQYGHSNLSLGGYDGSHGDTSGVLAGADAAFDDMLRVGVQAGVSRVNGNDQAGGNGRVDNVHGGVYAYGDVGPVLWSAVIDALRSDYHFNRATGIGTATSAPRGTMQSAAFQVAWPLQLTQWEFTPKAGAIYQRQTLDGFSETLNSTNPNASSFPVDAARSRYTALQPYAAMAIDRSFIAGNVIYVPQLSVGYRYDTHGAAAPLVQVTAQDGTVFDLPGSTQGRGMATATARITAEAGASWSVYAGYQGFFGSHLHDNAVSIGFTKHF